MKIMKRIWMIGFFLIFGLSIPVYGEETAEIQDVAAVTVQDLHTDSSKIIDNIYLDDVNLSGMGKEEALQAVQKHMDEISGYQIILRAEDQKINVPAKAFGITANPEAMIENALKIGHSGNIIQRYKVQKDLKRSPLQLELSYQVDPAAVQSVIENQAVSMNRAVRNMGLTRENGEFVIRHGVRGIGVQVESSVEKVITYLTQQWKKGVGEVALDVEITQPHGSYEELSKIQNVLGKGSTDYSSSSNARATNIRNATQMIDGTVLYPGEELSVCDTIHPFTEENGYAPAPSYENGEVVESLGGGICQVSTTLYLAILRAELQVTQRYSHSMIVNYVKPSMDAAIAEGVKDLKFVNNLDAPIYIQGYASDGELGFVIYGQEYRSDKRSVTYESEVIEEIESSTEIIADDQMPLGQVERIQSAHTGYEAKLWKVINDNGVETREEVNRSSYRMTPSKYRVGINTTDQGALQAMLDAIATQDINVVYEVRNAYS